MEQWSASQIPSFHCMLSPLSGALAPADTTSPYWTVTDANEERRGSERRGRCVQANTLEGGDEILTFDSVQRRMGGCSEDGHEVDERLAEERGDERRQEGVRSLPVPASHLAIHTAAMVMVCGSFQ